MAEEAKIDLKALEAITKKVLAYKPNKKDKPTLGLKREGQPHTNLHE